MKKFANDYLTVNLRYHDLKNSCKFFAELI